MPAALPTGTVTLLFTDIEGSTALLDEVGAQRYGELLAAHHRVCREAWAARGGSEVDTAGDAFFVAFATASDAVLAARAAQERIAELGLRVRMGVHTGEVLLCETGYVGLEVHRSARIAAAAHGGQVLVSATTAALLSAQGGVALLDLGAHRFKDLGGAEQVFQLGSESFPPIRSLYRSNLPVPGSEFLGRRSELAEVAGLLARDVVRLVTLTGPGGTGKTRLALQTAAEVSDAFPDGVWWVPLVPLRDASAVLPSLAQVLDVRHQPERDLADVLASVLAGKRTLLVLDNAEHLLPSLAAMIAGLRAKAPSITMLVTSRERLQLTGEEVWRVPALTEREGVELFLDRSRSLGVPVEDSQVVRDLCVRLDSLPLAIELAAARTMVFSPEQLLARLGQRLDLLKGGRDADPRQQTLRATIDWSYHLLDEHERQVFCALCVFSAGCTYESSEEVAGADPDTLQSLVEKSLLRRRDGAAGPRYSMLESIREYGAERLAERADGPAVWSRFDAFAETCADALGESYLSSGTDACFAAYADDRANLWLAIERARARPSALGRFVVALYNVWLDQGELIAARQIVNAVLGELEDLVPIEQARFLVAGGTLLGDGGDAERALAFARRAIPVFEDADDRLWLGRALCCASAGEMNIAAPAFSAEAARLLRRGIELSRAARDEVYLAIELINSADLSAQTGELGAAAALASEAGTIGKRLRHKLIRSQALALEARLARERGELDLCEQFVREALGADDPLRTLPDPSSLATLINELIHVATLRGEVEVAGRLVGACEALLLSAGLAGGWAEGLEEHVARLRAVASVHVVERATSKGRAMSTRDLVEFGRSGQLSPQTA